MTNFTDNRLDRGSAKTTYDVYPNLNICIQDADGWRVILHGMIQSEVHTDEDSAMERLMRMLRDELSA